MLKVYYLPVIKTDNTEAIAGINLIHHALLLTTENPNIRLLIMDTTFTEHNQLILLAITYRDPTPQEVTLYNQLPPEPLPDPDAIRAAELLATSPDVITQPEIWELLRIIGRRLGYIK